MPLRGFMPTQNLTYRKAIYSALDKVLTESEKTVFLGEDITEYGGAFGVSADLHTRHPARVIATPISEGGFMGVAVGMAMTGYRVVVEMMFMDFMTLAFDQIVNHAVNVHYMYGGQLACPVVIRTPAGGYRGYGPSHSKAMENMLFGVPGLKIMAPSTVQDAYGCLLTAVADNNPVLFVEHKLLYGLEDTVDLAEIQPVPFGKARIVRQGSDVTVVSHSYGAHLAEQAVMELEEEGIDAELIDLRSLKPLDIETIVESVTKTGSLVCVEEGNITGGIGSEVTAIVAERCLEYLDGRIIRVGRGDTPIPASLASEGLILPDKDSIKAAIRKSLRRL